MARYIIVTEDYYTDPVFVEDIGDATEDEARKKLQIYRDKGAKLDDPGYPVSRYMLARVVVDYEEEAVQTEG